MLNPPLIFYLSIWFHAAHQQDWWVPGFAVGAQHAVPLLSPLRMIKNLPLLWLSQVLPRYFDLMQLHVPSCDQDGLASFHRCEGLLQGYLMHSPSQKLGLYLHDFLRDSP